MMIKYEGGLGTVHKVSQLIQQVSVKTAQEKQFQKHSSKEHEQNIYYCRSVVLVKCTIQQVVLHKLKTVSVKLRT